MAKTSTMVVISSAIVAAIIIIAIIAVTTTTFNVSPIQKKDVPETTSAGSSKNKTSISEQTTMPPSPSASGISSPYIKEYNLPRKEIWPNGISADDGKTIWFTGTRSNSLFSFDPGTGRFEEFTLPVKSSSMFMGWGVATDNQGRVWFTDDRAGAIWRFDPSIKEFKKMELPTKSQGNLPTLPIQIAVDDRNGFVWFTELYGNKIGLIPQDSGSVYEFPTPTNSSGPSSLFIKDRYVWFTEALVNKIARYSYDDNEDNLKNLESRNPPSANIEEFAPSKQLYSPVGLFIDKKSNIWVTEHGSSFIARYNIANDTVFRLATSRNEGQAITLPYWIRSDANNNIWFTEHAGNRIAMFNTTDYTLTEYEVPTRNPKQGNLSNTMSLSVSPDGSSVWFTEWSEDKIGVVNSTVPLPFTIMASNNEIKIPRGGSADIAVSISARGNVGNNIINNNNNAATALILKTSGTETPSGRLFNITATFDPESVKVPINSKMTTTAKLTIKTDPSIKPGEYTITASATDGFVTKSVVIRLYIK